MDIKLSRFRWRWLLIGLALLIIVSLAVIQPWNSGPSTGQILAEASDPDLDVASYKVKFQWQEIRDASIPPVSASIVYSSPDRVHLTISSGDWQYESIRIGDSLYEKETGTRLDTPAKPLFHNVYKPLEMAYTRHMPDYLVDIESLPHEVFNGTGCYRLRGTLDGTDPLLAADLSDSIREQFDPDQIEYMIDLLIGKQDFLVRQAQHRESVNGETIRISTTTYYDFNEPTDLNPPLDEDGVLLPGWSLREDPVMGMETARDKTTETLSRFVVILDG